MKLRNRITLYCFSPLVMAATFSIELALAAYVAYRYGLKSTFNKMAVFLLVLLSVFQIAEFNICSGLSSPLWGRIGFLATALMPPLGLHLVSLTTGKRWQIPIGYIASAVFVFFYAVVPGSISGASCGGNYVLFSTDYPMFHIWYGVYYAVFLLWGLLAAYFAADAQNKNEASLLRRIAAGYTSFMLPAAISYILFPSSRGGFASILCGFAIFMALIVTFAVVPKHQELSRILSGTGSKTK